jgi:hypothetical protein
MSPIPFVAGGVLVVAGLVYIRFNEPVATWLGRVQSVIYGKWMGALVTPRLVRQLGGVSIALGVLLIALGAFVPQPR